MSSPELVVWSGDPGKGKCRPVKGLPSSPPPTGGPAERKSRASSSLGCGGQDRAGSMSRFPPTPFQPPRDPSGS